MRAKSCLGSFKELVVMMLEDNGLVDKEADKEMPGVKHNSSILQAHAETISSSDRESSRLSNSRIVQLLVHLHLVLQILIS